jgi:eukaryotic-like serine/threonine-protein kinase
MDVSTPTRAVGGRYRLLGVLGEGGMARVYDACDERLQRPVAVKILRHDVAAFPGMRRRFQQEARLAARLVHPNIVAVLDYGEDASFSYLVMERLSGRTLRDEMTAGPLHGHRVVRVLTETLSALSTAHRAGVLHRDIKPSNILLQEGGYAKISDFGIAKSMDLYGVTSDETITGVVMGTPGYLAPERRAGMPATVESDLYSVGAVMVEAVTGRRIPTDPTATIETLPPDFLIAARRSLAPDPAYRYHSAVAMLQAIRHPNTEPIMVRTTPVLSPSVAQQTVPFSRPSVGQPHTVRASPPRAPIPSPHRESRRRHPIRLALACVLVAIMGAVLALAVDPGLLQPSTATPPKSSPLAQASTNRGRTSTTAVDQVATSIRADARQLATDGMPGDAVLALALDRTADQPAGPDRQAAAQQDLELAQVLLAGGGITSEQYQNVLAVLEQTGATVPTTTTTTPTTSVASPPSTPPRPTGSIGPSHHSVVPSPPPSHGHHHHGGGNGQQ